VRRLPPGGVRPPGGRSPVRRRNPARHGVTVVPARAPLGVVPAGRAEGRGPRHPRRWRRLVRSPVRAQRDVVACGRRCRGNGGHGKWRQSEHTGSSGHPHFPRSGHSHDETFLIGSSPADSADNIGRRSKSHHGAGCEPARRSGPKPASSLCRFVVLGCYTGTFASERLVCSANFPAVAGLGSTCRNSPVGPVSATPQPRKKDRPPTSSGADRRARGQFMFHGSP
jgi:hypothetical protein